VSNNYKKGREAEYIARDILKEMGCTVVRSAGSKTPYDLIAWTKEEIYFIQVKRITKVPTVEEIRSLFKKDLNQIAVTQFPRRSHVQLWVYVPRGGWHRYAIIRDPILEVSPLVA